jgi:hypothetical protein
MASLLYIIGCENAEIQRSSPNDSEKITQRVVASCDDCPVDHCCCSVESQTHTDVLSLRFCGTSDGASGCTASGPSPCNSISGGGQLIGLDQNGFRKLFCLSPGNAFSVTNLSGSTADIYLSCQYNLTSPQIVPISIGNTQTVYYDSDSGCFLSQCQ